MNGDLKFRKMKEKEIPAAENLLRVTERACLNACSKFLSRDTQSADIWVLSGRKNDIHGLIVKSRSTVMPVLMGRKSIPEINFLKGFLRRKKIHSIQGLTGEVRLMEDEMEKMGGVITDIFDYNLMSMDKPPDFNTFLSGPSNLVLRVPALTDLEKIAPLQAAYEKEEVIPKGGVFSPEASKVKLAYIIANGKILTAELAGQIIAKINVSAVSFTRYQVGGVYVHPDFRGKGIARRMAAEFISSLINEGMGVTLFVKKANIAARRLYAGLGFEVAGDYRITYY